MNLVQYAAFKGIAKVAEKVAGLSKSDEGYGVREILGKFVSNRREDIKAAEQIESASDFSGKSIDAIDLFKEGAPPVVRMGDSLFTLNVNGVYLVCQAMREDKEWTVKKEILKALPSLAEEMKNVAFGIQKKWKGGVAPSDRYVDGLHLGDLGDLLYDSIEYVPLNTDDMLAILNAKVQASPGAKSDFQDFFGTKPSAGGMKKLPFEDLLEFDQRISLGALAPFFEEGGYTYRENSGYRLQRGISPENLVSRLRKGPGRMELEKVLSRLNDSLKSIGSLEKEEGSAGLHRNLIVRAKTLFFSRTVFNRIEEKVYGLAPEDFADEIQRMDEPLFSRFVSLQFSCNTGNRDFMKPTFPAREVKKAIMKIVGNGDLEREELLDHSPTVSIKMASLDFREALISMEIEKERNEQYSEIYKKRRKEMESGSPSEQKEQKSPGSGGILQSLVGVKPGDDKENSVPESSPEAPRGFTPSLF